MTWIAKDGWEILEVMDEAKITKKVEVYSREAKIALNRLQGKDMSWDAYNAIRDNILLLDARFEIELNERCGTCSQ